MNEISIIPNISKKTAKITGNAAAGEIVHVSIDGFDFPTDDLRLRVLCAGKIVAKFPCKDDDEWSTEGSVSCDINFNTVQCLKTCFGPDTQVLFVLEDVGDEPRLYFTQSYNLKGWPARHLDVEPFDLGSIPTLVSTWQGQLDNISLSATKENGVTTVTIVGKDGTSSSVQIVDGSDGSRGLPGQKGEKGDAFTYDDFTEEQLASLKGEKGDAGDEGEKGDDGVGITDFLFWKTENHRDYWKFYMSDERTFVIDVPNTEAIDDDIDSVRTEAANAVAEEEQRAVAAEGSLGTLITEEATRASGAEQANAQAISTESSRAVAAEGVLRAAIESFSGLETEVVDELPDEGKPRTMYLVPAQSSKTGNVKDEYLWVNNAWEKIGSTEVDLSQYAKKTEVPSVVSPSASAAEGSAASAKATGTALAGKLTCNNISGKTIAVNVSSTGGAISFSTSKDNSVVELLLSGHNGETIATTSQIPTATSELTNDSGFVTADAIPVKDNIANATSKIDAAGNVYTASVQNIGGYFRRTGGGVMTIDLVYDATRSTSSKSWFWYNSDNYVTYEPATGFITTQYFAGKYVATNINTLNGESLPDFSTDSYSFKFYPQITDFPATPTDRLARESDTVPSAWVNESALKWKKNGSSISVTVASGSTLSAVTTDWTDGQSQMAKITLASGASIASNIKLVGYATWPEGETFLAACVRVGDKIYVNIVCAIS